MVLSNQLNSGMTIAIGNKIYRVESSVKVTPSKGAAFIKARLRDLATNQTTEKNLKPNQNIEEVTLNERSLEFLYPEGDNYLFLDIGNLDQVLIPTTVIDDRVNYLKEGVDVKASFYGDVVFSVELPQFLELMVAKIEDRNSKKDPLAGGTRYGTLETGARIEIPPFIEVGDIVKVDTKTNEYIQRV